MGRLKEINSSVKKGSEGMLESGNHLIQQTNDFIKISNAAMSGMNEIVNGAMQEIQTAVGHVDEMSAANSKSFDELKAETEKFKVDTGGQKKTIIVVDDEKTVLAMTKGMLENDYEVITVSSGQGALNLFFQGYVPDLVLLDLQMPEMGGWDTYIRIRDLSQLHKVPIAIYSTSEDPADRARVREMGAVDFIRKPVKKTELLERVGKILG
jgi:CheY-like chemotaxis protein